MRTSSCEKSCSACGNSLIKFGKTPDGRQRYRCKTCKKVFTDYSKFTYGRKTAKLAALLKTIIKAPKLNSEELNNKFKNLEEEYKTCKANKIYLCEQEKNQTFVCKNPKLIVCLGDNDELIFYKIQNLGEEAEIKITHRKSFKIDPVNNHHYIVLESR